MLTLGAGTRVFVAVEPVDMRGSFDALAGHVRRLHADPLDGHVYLFFSRNRRLLKALWFDRSGCFTAGSPIHPAGGRLITTAATAERSFSSSSRWVTSVCELIHSSRSMLASQIRPHCRTALIRTRCTWAWRIATMTAPPTPSSGSTALSPG